jgi:hypothetical protein
MLTEVGSEDTGTVPTPPRRAMANASDAAVLAAILDRLIPPDGGFGARALRLEAEVARRVPGVTALVERLSDFESLDAAMQDEVLRALAAAGDETFAALVAAAHELYYADPRTWPQIGYTTNLPGRP